MEIVYMVKQKLQLISSKRRAFIKTLKYLCYNIFFCYFSSGNFSSSFSSLEDFRSPSSGGRSPEAQVGPTLSHRNCCRDQCYKNTLLWWCRRLGSHLRSCPLSSVYSSHTTERLHILLELKFERKSVRWFLLLPCVSALKSVRTRKG